MRSSRGFTLIELLVVIAIIGLLSSIVMAGLAQARNKAKVAKARAELNGIFTAVTSLINDTSRLPTAFPTKPLETTGCTTPPNIDNNEVEANSPAAGLAATDGNFPNWAGPYMNVPLDPWGNAYVYDEDYVCHIPPIALGCEGYDGPYVRAVHSRGPNGSPMNTYDADNIVKVICSH